MCELHGDQCFELVLNELGSFWLSLAWAALVFGPLPDKVPPAKTWDPHAGDFNNSSDADRDMGSMSVSGARSGSQRSWTGPTFEKGT